MTVPADSEFAYSPTRISRNYPQIIGSLNGDEMSCRILLADDHEVVRSGLKAVLRFERDITICGEASEGMDTIR